MKNLFLILLFLPVFAKGQIITTVAGGGTGGLGDGGLATAATIGYTGGLAVDRSGNIYIADANNQRVRKVDATTGIITTIAGTGTPGYNGDNIAATTAKLNLPAAVSVDTFGNLYITDDNNYRIRKVDVNTGIITTFAGNGIFGHSGDDSLATNAKITGGFTAWDAFGNMYIGDNYRIRKVDASGIITTVAGTGLDSCVVDSAVAITANINDGVISTDRFGNVYFSSIDSCVTIHKINFTTGIISRVAGTNDHIGIPYSGDGLLATSCHIYPIGVIVDDTGNLYIADYENQRIEKVDTTGTIYTIAGNGVNGFGGDNGLATAAKISYPENVALDPCGNVYIMDFNNKRVRKVTFDTSCNLSTLKSTSILPESTITIFPNPATTSLTIQPTAQPITEIIITNLLGQTIYTQQQTTTQQQTIDVSTFPTGIYFIKINNTEVRKFVKE